MPGGHARGVTWTLHGHQWERQPYTCVSDGGSPAKCVPGTGSSMIGDRNDPGTGTGSDYYGTQEGINPTGHWDIVVDLGGNADVHGDYLLGDQASFGRYQGLWGLLRFDFTPPVAVDAEISTPKYLCDAAGANCQPGTADIDLLALASDLDGDAASVEITTGPGFGTLTPTGGTVTFTYPLGTPWPCADPFACSTSFTYTVTDAQGLESNTGAVTVTVTNTAPVVNDDSIIIKTPDTSGSVDVLLNDFDAEGDVAEDRIRSVDLGTPTDPNGVGGTAGVLNGVVTYSGPFDSAGVVSVPYTVTDESGAVSNTAHVRIAVNVDDVRITNARYQPVNDHWTVGGTCTDPVHLDGSTPTIITIYSGMSLPSPGFDPPVVGTAPCLAGDPIGTWAFSGTSTAPEPDPNAFNLVSAQSDFMTGGGGFHLAYPVEFAGQNNPPVAVDDGYTIDEDQVLNGDVLANDADADFDPLTVFKVSGPSNGTVVLNPDGTFTYTPDANWSGVDTFQYQADDGKALSNLATVTITVNPVNDAPFAFGEGYAMAQGTVLNVVEPGVLGNDSDVEGDYITLNTTPVSGPAAGNSLTLNADGSFTYTPDPLFTGTDSFVYQICETENPDVCSQATVTISVGVNDAPVAVDDQYITPQITATQLDPLEVAAPGVLDNDTDADGDPLTVSAVNGNPASVGVQITLASGATLTLNIDGSFTYTPVFNFVGTDSFTYVANDGTVDSNTATVTIAVEDVVTVTSARFRPGRRGAPGRWNIQGTVSYSLSQVNVYLVRPGADPVLIGPASVDAITGDWSFNGTSTVVGAEGDTVRAVSSGGGEGEYVLQAGDIR